jgi:hypothetical protein
MAVKLIDRIIVAACKEDMHLLLICIASIRYYYPNIQISLIKDLSKGTFDSREVQIRFDVSLYDTPYSLGGWGFIKLVPLIELENERIMILDADTVFLGNVLDSLQEYHQDVVVAGYMQHQPEAVKQSYFDLNLMAHFDSNFKFNGHVFNTGQILYETQYFSQQDFENCGVVFNQDHIQSSRTDLFGFSEQGIVNYVVSKKSQQKEISVYDADFMIWPPICELDIKTEELKNGENYPKVMHWAGPKDLIIQLLPFTHVLAFFQDKYYEHLSWGGWVKFYRMLKRSRWIILLSRFRKLILKK